MDEQPVEVRPFKNLGWIRNDLRDRFMALYRVVKNRKHTIALLDMFWPADVQKPTNKFNEWFNAVEYGKCRIPKQVQDWVQQQVEQEVINDLAATGREASLTLRKLLKEYREGTSPDGGVVAIRYLQEAARDQFGKRAEILNAATGGAKRVPGGKVGVITNGKDAGKVRPGLRAVK